MVAAGLDGYIVADNGNALLIYPIDQEQKVKQIVNEVGLRFGENISERLRRSKIINFETSCLVESQTASQ